ncbi:MAG: hypothetical protein ACHQ7H_06105 [Candidatus Rokuibacteriota bacterium]|jgi:FMN phosphatase YigB (HAD superfamily)
MKAVAFDAYGTLFDVLSITALGAGSVGLETFWIQRRVAEPPEELGFTADHTVDTITDLAAPLGG